MHMVLLCFVSLCFYFGSKWTDVICLPTYFRVALGQSYLDCPSDSAVILELLVKLTNNKSQHKSVRDVYIFLGYTVYALGSSLV